MTMGRPRLTNNVIAGLEDAQALCKTIRAGSRRISRRATDLMDPVLLAEANEIVIAVADLERKLADARKNHYEQELSDETTVPGRPAIRMAR
jgi:NTP pyrophosphatase (non-canonical NTP hydrolase)